MIVINRSNICRYWELVPDLESARERIKELEQQLEEACKKLEEQESKQKETYLKMYNQGHEAAKLEFDQQVSFCDNNIKLFNIFSISLQHKTILVESQFLNYCVN